MRKRKAPCLSDQRRGPDGRIIFSKEYVDFIMYRDLQPLVDLRVLQRIEEMLLSKIRDQQLVEQLEETKLTGEVRICVLFMKTSDLNTLEITEKQQDLWYTYPEEKERSANHFALDSVLTAQTPCQILEVSFFFLQFLPSNYELCH